MTSAVLLALALFGACAVESGLRWPGADAAIPVVIVGCLLLSLGLVKGLTRTAAIADVAIHPPESRPPAPSGTHRATRTGAFAEFWLLRPAPGEGVPMTRPIAVDRHTTGLRGNTSRVVWRRRRRCPMMALGSGTYVSRRTDDRGA